MTLTIFAYIYLTSLVVTLIGFRIASGCREREHLFIAVIPIINSIMAIFFLCTVIPFTILDNIGKVYEYGSNPSKKSNWFF